MAPKRTTRARPALKTTTTTTSVTNAQLQAMIDQGVTAALAACDANRAGDDSHTSGTDCVSHKPLLGGESDQVFYLYSFSRCSDVVEFPR
ncbi:hypothetical protein Tco_1526887 [Tanacetum coccineum]